METATWRLLLQGGTTLTASALGDLPVLCQTLLIVMLLDTLARWIAITTHGTLSGAVLKRMLLLKLAVVVAGSIAYVLERRMGVPVLTPVVSVLVLNEVVSAFRNLARAGVYLPPNLLRALRAMREEGEEGAKEGKEPPPPGDL